MSLAGRREMERICSVTTQLYQCSTEPHARSRNSIVFKRADPTRIPLNGGSGYVRVGVRRARTIKFFNAPRLMTRERFWAERRRIASYGPRKYDGRPGTGKSDRNSCRRPRSNHYKAKSRTHEASGPFPQSLDLAIDLAMSFMSNRMAPGRGHSTQS
jgi:hypothetical protein